jgi:hypothetical protein
MIFSEKKPTKYHAASMNSPSPGQTIYKTGLAAPKPVKISAFILSGSKELSMSVTSSPGDKYSTIPGVLHFENDSFVEPLVRAANPHSRDEMFLNNDSQERIYTSAQKCTEIENLGREPQNGLASIACTR